MIELRVLSYQEYHKSRSSLPHQVWHSTPRRETSGLTPTSHWVRGERDLGLYPEFASNPEERISSLVPEHIQPQGRSFKTKPLPDHNNTSLLWGFLPSLELTQRLDIPRSNNSPISMEAVTNGSGYPGMTISTIKHSNSRSYRSILTRKLCRYEDLYSSADWFRKSQ